MKLVTFRDLDRLRVGMIDPARGQVKPLDWVEKESGLGLLDLVRHWPEWEARVRQDGATIPAAGLRLSAPIPRPARNLFCVGKNYRAHAQEFARSGFDASAGVAAASVIPAAPIVFTKAPQTVVGPGEAIRFPHGVSEQLDYEAELGVVIGRGGRAISRRQAWNHVWGYTILNDVTARDWQARHQQWFLGKSFDTFCPMGPWLVSADEVDAENLTVRCWVNGELRQEANTRELIFGVPELIETISAGITLHPGDIIATGTPEGVGIGFTPPRFLRPGDRVRISVSGLGTLENPVQ